MNGTYTRYQGKRGITWHGRYSYVDPATGQRRWKRAAAPTKKACQQKVNEALAKLHAGEIPKDGKLTVGAYFARWLAAHEPNVRATTHRRYAGIVANHVTPRLGDLKLTRLSALDLQTHYSRLLAAGSSPAAVAYTHTVIRAGLGAALRWGLVDRNVATLVTPPRVTTTEFATWSRNEVNRVLAIADATDLAAFWRVALLCGLRRGELLGLWWEDLDLDRGALAVRRTMQKTKTGWALGLPKTTAGRRSLTVPAATVAALRQQQDRQAFARQQLGDLWHDGPGFVFTNQTGGPLHVNTIIDRFERLVADAGVPRIRFHDLRHTCATLMLQAGVPVHVVARRLGHAKPSMTLNVYAHSVAGDDSFAADALERALADTEVAHELPKLG